ncbi:xanthine dehydrogenase family protein, FAD-binding subunit [Neobacillus bataviensis LMG 21833]|uniref:Xanthine dehydrogenase family protein, FAD-binding subunit n=1 Tax=Neobacillus bataviensis LMG 21833 TaxID=1117379 RepID=K6C3L9_9BACI|nr:FAD binding domain-containing protein [Neobacillus bataviensis]EKN65740.1 xanthine dehydrogenase family protein, FAD-binding subunit [Neobacillus bataviensis LMG 21833]
MIPFDFEYFKPNTISEAVQTFRELQNQGKQVIYYSGGTEFITFSRINQMKADAVIDIKGIPECHVLEQQEDQLVIGAAVSLNKISESALFPLLGQTVKQIADHTSRNKITIGGNINSRLIYREGILPLLLSEAKVKLAGNEGEIVLPLANLFDRELKLDTGEFLVHISVKKSYMSLPFASLKKTKISKISYPVVSIAALLKEQQIRAAFSGVCEFPFRSDQVEAALNETSLSKVERIDKVVSLLPSPIVDDIQASSEYREFVLKNALHVIIDALEVAPT